jgi:hypothetical protein
MAGNGSQAGTIETRIPARLDRLPWSRFHWMIVIGLGTVWILDGLEEVAKPLTAGEAERRAPPRPRRFRPGPARIATSPGTPVSRSESEQPPAAAS